MRCTGLPSRLPLYAPLLSIGLVLLGLGAAPARAHCDGMDGPVVRAAQHALEQANVNLVLIWVRSEEEGEVRAAFAQTLAVRKLGPEARALADRYFFETVVRLHRLGEGAPYTGLKPAGQDLGPAIPAADRALETGSAEPLRALLDEALLEGLEARFHEARAARGFDADDVVAGRRYVHAYVVFIHYAERLYEAARRPADGHDPEATEVGPGHAH
jgi:hypothetical protein